MTARSTRSTSLVLRRQSINAFVVSVGGILLTVVAHVVLARVLGVDEYGTYTFAFAWVGILGMGSLLGFNVTLVRYVAQYRVLQEWELLRGLLSFSTRIVAVTGVVLAAGGAGVVWLLSRGLLANSDRVLLVGLLAVPLLGLNGCRQATLKALKRVAWAASPEQVLRPLTIAVVVGGLFAGGIAVSATGAMWVTVGAIAVASVVGTLALRRSIPREVGPARPQRHVREWLGLSIPMTAVSGMNVLLARTDVLMLGIIQGPAAAGVYAVSARLATLASLGYSAVASIAPALISEGHAQESPDDVQRTLREAARFILVLTIPIVAGLVTFGGPGLRLFGPEFVTGYSCLLILLGGQTLNTLLGASSAVLTMTGLQRVVTRIGSVTVVVNFCLNLVFIPRFGLNGAAIATSSSLAAREFTTWVFVRRRVGLDPSALSLLRRQP